MSTSSVQTTTAETAARLAEAESTINHIRDLVFLRDFLATRGATPVELREYEAVIDSARRELAESAKAGSAAYATAA